MSTGAAVWLVLVVGVVAANLPFVNERLFIVGPVRAPKSLGWRLVELVLLYGLTLGLGFLLEARIGQRQPQGWEFYAAAGCLFITLAFPGFVWRYLRRRH
jgi:Na+(H+)/acetate symporter ActP